MPSVSWRLSTGSHSVSNLRTPYTRHYTQGTWREHRTKPSTLPGCRPHSGRAAPQDQAYFWAAEVSTQGG